MNAQSLSRAQRVATLWTVARQAPLSWDFLGKNPLEGCRTLLQGNLPTPGVKPAGPASPALAEGFSLN